MALVLGTNCGFVTVAPTTDPSDGFATVDGRSVVMRDTSPSTAVKIVEVGWFRDPSSDAENPNFEVGLYAADGAVVPGEAGTRLYREATNDSGTTPGWISVSVDWAISPSTDYWIGFQLDATAGTVYTNISGSGGNGYDSRIGATSLGNPFSGGDIFDTDGMYAFYALWEAAPPSTFTPKASFFM